MADPIVSTAPAISPAPVQHEQEQRSDGLCVPSKTRTDLTPDQIDELILAGELPAGTRICSSNSRPVEQTPAVRFYGRFTLEDRWKLAAEPK